MLALCCMFRNGWQMANDWNLWLRAQLHESEHMCTRLRPWTGRQSQGHIQLSEY